MCEKYAKVTTKHLDSTGNWNQGKVKVGKKFSLDTKYSPIGSVFDRYNRTIRRTFLPRTSSSSPTFLRLSGVFNFCALASPRNKNEETFRIFVKFDSLENLPSEELSIQGKLLWVTLEVFVYFVFFLI